MAASPDAVLHLAALHTLASAGFASTSRAASMTLSGVLARYLELVASSCAERAALAGRSKVAAIDVVNALDDLGVGGITELQEWTLDLDKEVTFTGGRLDELAGYLRDGLAINEGVHRFYVPVDDEDADEEEEDEEIDMHGDEREEERGDGGEDHEKGSLQGRQSPVKATVSTGGSPRPASPEKRPASPHKSASPEKPGSPLRPGSPVKPGSPTKSTSPPKDSSPAKAAAALPGSPKKTPTPEPGSAVQSGAPAPGSPVKPPAVQPGSPIRPGSPVKAATPVVAGSPATAASPIKEDVKEDAQVKDGSPVKEEPAATEATAADSVPKEAVKTDAPMDEDVKMDEDATTAKDAQVDAARDGNVQDVRAASDEATKDARKEEDRDSMMDVDEAPPRAASPQLPTPPPSPPYLRVNYRPRSPDMSWLPPLPTADVQAVAAAGAEIAEAAPEPQSIADKYRQPVPFHKSQLSEQLQADKRVWLDPPKQERLYVPDAPTSFHALVTAYEATATEPSVALRQTDGRRQAADLLRLTVGNPDRFSTRDTLAQPLPAPHISPIVPSHSDVLPSRLLPVNPNQNGVISSILHQIRTPYLPPPLRERLTSLRPPQAQTNEQGPVLYGEPVRGADDAALAKARGKATGEEPTAVFRATWDSGPKGQEKWSKGRLPTGRKVTKSAVGASAPREEGAKPLRIKIGDRPGLSMPETPAFSPATTLKLRLGGPKAAGTPTVERTSHPLAGSSADNTDNISTPTSSSMPLRLFTGSSSRQKSSSPSKRRTASPGKRSISPIKHEPMQLD